MQTLSSNHDTTGRNTDLVTVVLGTWLMIGLFLDGYAHANIIEELESFFTPWHAVFYSGFLATAGWILYVVYKRLGKRLRVVEAIPGGYGLSVAGIGLFAAGGIGDGIWHTIYGIETGVDALLSPTHLLLFTGILLIMSTPLRTALLRSRPGHLDGIDKVTVTLSTTLTTALIAFFFVYLWAPGHAFWAERPYNPVTGSGEGSVALGMGAIMLSNLILLTPVVVVLARWRPPVGMFTTVWVIVNALTATAFDLEIGLALGVGLVGGVSADVLIRVLGAGPGRDLSNLVTLAVTPLTSWSVYFALIAAFGDLRWQPEIWGGAIFFSGLAGLGLGLLTFPRPMGQSTSRPAR